MIELTNTLPRDASPEQRLNLRHLRERTYLPDEQAPYHGISHPDKVWSNAEVLMERCAAYSIPVDGDALRNAIELHDALSHLPPRMLGHESAESVAAEVTFHFLIDCGYSEEAALKIKNIVMATNPEVRPASPEEIIIRAADLWNIGSTFNEFRKGSFALHQEAQLARQTEVPFAAWMRGAFIYLERFMWPMLELTPESKDPQGRSVFHTNALRNMATLWRETFGEHTPVSVEFFLNGTIRPSIHDPQEFYIAIHPEEPERKGSLARLAEDASACNGAAFAVPGVTGAFPLPDEFCSRVVCHDTSLESLVEALRITSRGGTVVLDLLDQADPRVMDIASLFECSVSEGSPDGAPHKRLTITKEAHL
jgi:hypothetical protein